jgi:hypothetical protein
VETQQHTPGKTIPESEWEWFGNVGHLIVGSWCRFHLTTVVGQYLISTVGFWVPPKAGERAEADWLAKHPEGEEIGPGRFYETMVFVAGERCGGDCGCGLPSTNGHELDFAGYQKPAEAQRGHMEMCRKWAAVADAEGGE